MGPYLKLAIHSPSLMRPAQATWATYDTFGGGLFRFSNRTLVESAGYRYLTVAFESIK